MKKVLILLTIFASCKKSDPQPATATTNHTLSVIDNNATLLINGVQQTNINETFTVKAGDVIEVTNFGDDSWNPETGIQTEGTIYCRVILDNVIIYERRCGCDANFTYTIN